MVLGCANQAVGEVQVAGKSRGCCALGSVEWALEEEVVCILGWGLAVGAAYGGAGCGG